MWREKISYLCQNLNCLLPMAKVLIVTPHIQDKSGGGLVNQRNIHVIEGLEADVTVIAIDGKDKGFHSSVCGKVWERARGIFGGLSASYVRVVAKCIETEHPQYVWLNQSTFGYLAYWMRREFPEIQVITYFHNCEADYFAAMKHAEPGLKTSVNYWSAWKAEKLAVRYSNRLIAMNKRDSEALKRRYGRGADCLCPTTFEDCGAVNYRVSSIEEPLRLLFVGFNFFGNTQGVDWFVKSVMPRLNHSILTIVGRGMEQWRQQWQSNTVQVVGTVDNLKEWYAQADLVVSPILSGSGMKTKTAEAFMYGLPVVGTPEAFEGYDVNYDRIGHLCSSEDEFVQVISRFEQNRSLLPELSQNARQCLLEKYAQRVDIHIFRQLIQA